MVSQTKRLPASNYLLYLDEQCVKAFKAAERFNFLLIKLKKPPQSRNEDKGSLFYDLFDNLHIFCVEAALVSKTIWPSCTNRKRHNRIRKCRGDGLRNLLQINESNSIRDRTLRDSIEHFDERLDQWMMKDGNTYSYFDRILFDDYNKTFGVSGSPAPKDMILRAYDVQNNIYIFMGSEYDIKRMSNDLLDIQKKVEFFTRSNEQALRNAFIGYVT